jgi:hypothetical protein
MADYLIPLIIRGAIIEDDLVGFDARHGQLSFRTPDVKKYLSRLVLRDPNDLADLYRLSLAEIVDYLVELGPRLDIAKNAHVQQAYEMVIKSSHQTPEMTRLMFEIFPRLLTHAHIDEYIDRNIGREYLEGWVDETYSDRRVAVRAFGARAVHVIPGNTSLVAITTIIANAVTRGDAIIKIPSNDPFFATAMARTMIEMAPDHPLTRHVSVGYWKGGDAQVEKALYDAKSIEKIVAWGGFDSMRSIRQYLAPGIDLVALDPKISGSIIGEAAFASDATLRDAAAKAAFDIGHHNQGGCASCRTIYLVSGTDAAGLERANRFGELVFEALQNLPPHLSSAHPAFDPVLRGEIDGIRYSDAYKVFGGRASEGAIIVSQEDEEVDFSERLDCRVANVVPVDSLDAAVRHVTVHMQTVGVYPDSLKAEIRDACALRGSQRIVPLGCATAGSQVGPWDAMEPLRRMVRWLRDDSMDRPAGYLHV